MGCVNFFFFVTSQITLFLLTEKKRAHIENNEENTKEQSIV